MMIGFVGSPPFEATKCPQRGRTAASSVWKTVCIGSLFRHILADCMSCMSLRHCLGVYSHACLIFSFTPVPFSAARTAPTHKHPMLGLPCRFAYTIRFFVLQGRSFSDIRRNGGGYGTPRHRRTARETGPIRDLWRARTALARFSKAGPLFSATFGRKCNAGLIASSLWRNRSAVSGVFRSV